MLSPAELVLPALEVGCPGDAQSLTVTNGCGFEVVVRKIELSSAKQGVHLVRAPPVPSAGLALAAGASLHLSVKALAAEPGDQGADLVVTLGSQAKDAGRAWPVAFIASPQTLVTETFSSPPYEDRANRLVVIDNGPLLQPWLPSVRANLKEFARFSVVAQFRGRLAVTTTGGSGAVGRADFVGGILDLEDPSFTTAFGALLDGLEVRPGNEDPVQVGVDVLEAEWMAGTRSGLVDPDVDTQVLLITAGPDRSPSAATDQFRLLRFFTGANQNSRRLSISTIIPLTWWSAHAPSCGLALPKDDGVLVYLTQYTNGVSDSICTPDWSKTLEGLGTYPFGSPIRRLWLSQTPGLTRGPILVSIDGYEVPPVDPQRGATIWKYDSVTESIIFEPVYVPEPGQEVTVTYAPLCPDA